MNTPPRARTKRVDHIPPTPLHGAKFDSPPPASRKGKGTSSSSSTYSTATLSPPPSSPLGPDSSFEQTRKHRKRRASVLDEPAEKPVEVESEGWKELEKMFGGDFGRGPTVVPSGVGLPTPSKTPARKRKHLSIESVAGSARRLFGSTSFTPAPVSTSTKSGLLGAMLSGSKKKGKGRLDLTGEDENDGGSISIFTDNNARIPKFDPSPENPFITRPGDAKKKRQNKAKAADKLGVDGRREDGMVYIFRGKKMFRKFADMHEVDEPLPALESGEEEAEEDDEVEEEEDEDEEISRVLSKRSSIRPRLLFPSKVVELEEPSGEEEEAETDIEDEPSQAISEEISRAGPKKSGNKIGRKLLSRLTPESDDDPQPDMPGSKSSRVRFAEDDILAAGSIARSPRRKPSMPDDTELGKPIKGLFAKDIEDGRSIKTKRRRSVAFEGSLSPPRKGKKSKDLMA